MFKPEEGYLNMETDNPFEWVLDRLREKGWMKGSFGPTHGPNCLVGASQNVPLPGIGWERLCDRVDMVVKEQYPERRKGSLATVPNFNDHPDTTFSDVERVLEKAAVKWEEERVLRND